MFEKGEDWGAEIKAFKRKSREFKCKTITKIEAVSC